MDTLENRTQSKGSASQLAVAGIGHLLNKRHDLPDLEVDIDIFFFKDWPQRFDIADLIAIAPRHSRERQPGFDVGGICSQNTAVHFLGLALVTCLLVKTGQQVLIFEVRGESTDQLFEFLTCVFDIANAQVKGMLAADKLLVDPNAAFQFVVYLYGISDLVGAHQKVSTLEVIAVIFRMGPYQSGIKVGSFFVAPHFLVDIGQEYLIPVIFRGKVDRLAGIANGLVLIILKVKDPGQLISSSIILPVLFEYSLQNRDSLFVIAQQLFAIGIDKPHL